MERVIEGKGGKKAKTRREGCGKVNNGRSTGGSIYKMGVDKGKKK